MTPRTALARSSDSQQSKPGLHLSAIGPNTGVRGHEILVTLIPHSLRSGGLGGVSQYSFGRSLRGMKDAEFHRDRLIRDGVVHRVTRQPVRGRPGIFYIHRDHWKEGSRSIFPGTGVGKSISDHSYRFSVIMVIIHLRGPTFGLSAGGFRFV